MDQRVGAEVQLYSWDAERIGVYEMRTALTVDVDLEELKIMELLLSNRVNADYDPDIYGLLGRVRGWIDGLNSARPPSESPAQHH